MGSHGTIELPSGRWDWGITTVRRLPSNEETLRYTMFRQGFGAAPVLDFPLDLEINEGTVYEQAAWPHTRTVEIAPDNIARLRPVGRHGEDPSEVVFSTSAGWHRRMALAALLGYATDEVLSEAMAEAWEAWSTSR